MYNAYLILGLQAYIPNTRGVTVVELRRFLKEKGCNVYGVKTIPDKPFAFVTFGERSSLVHALDMNVLDIGSKSIFCVEYKDPSRKKK